MADLTEHVIMAETMHDPDHMTISLAVELSLRRTVAFGDRTEALNQMAEAVWPELAYMQQRLIKIGMVPTFKMVGRTPMRRPDRRCAPADIEKPWERRLPLRIALLQERDELVRAIGSVPDDEAPMAAQVERLETVEQLLRVPG